MKYKPLENNPIASFWYKGTHSHPVRRTVLLIDQIGEYITGYELREGNEVRNAEKAPIKSYRKDKIAKGKSLRAGSQIRMKNPNKSTLVRKSLIDLIKSGL